MRTLTEKCFTEMIVLGIYCSNKAQKTVAPVDMLLSRLHSIVQVECGRKVRWRPLPKRMLGTKRNNVVFKIRVISWRPGNFFGGATGKEALFRANYSTTTYVDIEIKMLNDRGH